jgi:hypothetical protein
LAPLAKALERRGLIGFHVVRGVLGGDRTMAFLPHLVDPIARFNAKCEAEEAAGEDADEVLGPRLP